MDKSLQDSANSYLEVSKLLRDERDMFRNCALGLLEMLGSFGGALLPRQTLCPRATGGRSGGAEVRDPAEEGVEQHLPDLEGEVRGGDDRQAAVVPISLWPPAGLRGPHNRQDAEAPARDEYLSSPRHS